MRNSVKRLILNGAYVPQRVTGQQRYAGEICQELLTEYPDLCAIKVPPKWLESSALLVWFWVQFLGLYSLRSTVLSLTSRAPLFARNHIVVIHDLFVITHPEWFSPTYVRTHRPLLRWILRRATCLVAVSEPTAQTLRKFTYGRKPVIVAPNAPAAQFTSRKNVDQTRVIAAKYKLDRYVLAVGSIDPRKNVERLVLAWASIADSVPDFELVLVGAAHAAFASPRLKIGTTRVKHLGYVPDEELSALYQGSSLVTFLSLDEGFGLPAVEALAAGATLLVSDIPIMRWVCESNANYADPFDVAAIASSIRHILTSSPPTDGGERVSRAIARRFMWSKSASVIAEYLGWPSI